MKTSPIAMLGLSIPLATACAVSSPDAAPTEAVGQTQEAIWAGPPPPPPPNPEAAQDCENIIAFANSDRQAIATAVASGCPDILSVDGYYRDIIEMEVLAAQVCPQGYDDPSAWLPRIDDSYNVAAHAINTCDSWTDLNLRCPIYVAATEDLKRGCGKRIGIRWLWRMCTTAMDYETCQRKFGEGFSLHREATICSNNIQISYSRCAINAGATLPATAPASAALPSPPAAPTGCHFWANCGGAVSAYCPFPLPATMNEIVLYRDDTGSNPVSVAWTTNIPQSTQDAPALYISDPGVPSSVSVGNYMLCAFDEYGQYGCTGKSSVTIDFTSCGGATSGGGTGDGSGGTGGSGGGRVGVVYNQ